MPVSQTSTRRKNHDVQCLKCGTFNITDNRICGRCGANLPLIYDEKGQVFYWEEARGYEALTHQQEVGKRRASVDKTRWILRAMILIIAVLLAIYIINSRS